MELILNLQFEQVNKKETKFIIILIFYIYLMFIVKIYPKCDKIIRKYFNLKIIYYN